MRLLRTSHLYALQVQAEEEERAEAARRAEGGPAAAGAGGPDDGDTVMADAPPDDAADALLAASRGHTASVAQRMAGGVQTLAVHAPLADGGPGEGSVVPPAAAASGAFDGVLIDGFRVPEVRAATSPAVPGVPAKSC